MNKQSSPVQISVVTTLYKSRPYIKQFYERMTAVLQQLACPYEIVFVDDGSPDLSASDVRDIISTDDRVVLVELSRNFGHHYAILAGLSQACGRQVFLIDSDLEEQPEWLTDFIATAKHHGADVVYGIQKQRGGGLFKQYSGGLFYKLFNSVSETEIPDNVCTVRLMTRDFVDALLSLGDRNVFLAGNLSWVGFKQVPVYVQKQTRQEPSNYTITRMLALFINAITSFSSYPLRLIFFIGLLISGLAGLFGANMLLEKLLYPESIQLGYASIIVSIWFLGGLIILFVGIIGIYLSKMFVEVKDRPLYIVRKVYRQEGGERCQDK